MNRRLGEVGHPFIPRAREAVGAEMAKPEKSAKKMLSNMMCMFLVG